MKGFPLDRACPVRSESFSCEELTYALLFRRYPGLDLMERSFGPGDLPMKGRRCLDYGNGQALF